MNYSSSLMLVFFLRGGIPIATIWDRFLLLIGRRVGFIVSGGSMLPTLKEGDAVLVDRTAAYRAGDVVLAEHPYKRSVKMLKRVEHIDERGRFLLIGDNPGESTDSRTFGAVSVENIVGKATCRLK